MSSSIERRIHHPAGSKNSKNNDNRCYCFCYRFLFVVVVVCLLVDSSRCYHHYPSLGEKRSSLLFTNALVQLTYPTTTTTTTTTIWNKNIPSKFNNRLHGGGGTSSSMKMNLEQQQSSSQQQYPLDPISPSISKEKVGDDPYTAHWKLYPRTYKVYPVVYNNSRTDKFLYHLNGNVLQNDIWKDIPWSDTFHDIQGNDIAIESVIDIPVTKFKCIYDDTHIYFGAILYPAYHNNITTEAHYIERNSPIFQLDSDYEIFIDTYQHNHQYKEFEMNAINTVWNLLLNKPYSDNGYEHSGRVTNDTNANNYYEVYSQKTATYLLDGVLNDHEHQQGALWSLEVAFAYSDLYATVPSGILHHNNNNLDNSDDDNVDRTDVKDTKQFSTSKDRKLLQKQTNNVITDTNSEQSSSSSPPRTQLRQPQPGDSWRINFSRVEKRGEINWTWQPQIVWDPKQQKYCGKIDMHLPDAWGYLYFSDEQKPPSPEPLQPQSSETTTIQHQQTLEDDTQIRDVTFPAKLTAMTLYYALHDYYKSNGSYTDNIADLSLPSADILEPFQIEIQLYQHVDFFVTVSSTFDDTVVTVQSDRYLQVGTKSFNNNKNKFK